MIQGIKKLSTEELMLLSCGVGEDSWESLGLQGDPTSPSVDWFEKTVNLGKLKAGGEGDDRGWDGWMASQTQWTWVWVNSGSWWWTGRPGVLWFMGLQRVRQNWATELNWTRHELYYLLHIIIFNLLKWDMLACIFLCSKDKYKLLIEGYIQIILTTCFFLKGHLYFYLLICYIASNI